MRLIQFKEVSKRFEHWVFSNLNLNLHANKFICILGPSGCGKSTLFRMICDLETPTTGKILGVPENKSMVFQDSNLLPWLTVRENIDFPLQLKKLKKDPSLTDLLLKQLRLANKDTYLPFQLSGGMKMRTAIARSLVTQPELVLLDEPFSALDEPTRFDLQNLIRADLDSSEKTVLMVTHSISESVFLSDEIIIMNLDGKIMFHEQVRLDSLRDSALRSSMQYFNEVNRFQELYNEAQK